MKELPSFANLKFPVKNLILIMVTINVKENESIEKALKRFKKKFEKTGTLKELRSRTHFEKPSVQRRNERIKAAYRQRIRSEENQ
jgi:small subunit ribosomal protein S21